MSTEDLAEQFRQHAEGLRRFVFGVVRNRETAADVVQATFAKAMQAENLEAQACKNWLYRVAFHEAVTWRRRFDADRRATEELKRRLHREDEKEVVAPLIRQEMVVQAREALSILSEKQRQVVSARIFEEKTFAEIADSMGLPLGTVLTHMRRALEKLRQKLKSNDGIGTSETE